jgi:uncharacterized protein involved in exopolysaccharide biosynthesis
MDNVSDRRALDIGLIVRIVKKRKSVFVTTMVGLLALTILYLQIAPRTYEVSMQIAPAAGNNQSASGGLGALTRLAGVDVSNLTGGAGQFRLFLSALNSRDTADLLARNQPLMRAMFPKEWFQTEQKWKSPASLTRPLTHAIETFVGYPVHEWQPPDGARVAQYLKDNLEIYEDPKSPVVTLRIDSDSPQVSRQLLTSLTSTVDTLLRQRALKRAGDYVAYLSRELGRETVAEYREALMDHIAEQEQTLMMASADVSFAIQIFSAPSNSQYPSSPKAAILLISALVFGAVFGVVMSILAERWEWPIAPFSAFWDRLSNKNPSRHGNALPRFARTHDLDSPN